MPLKSQRESDSRNVNRVMFDTITGVEEIYRKVVTPGLDNLNRASRLGIRLKSVHMVSNTLHQRPMTTSRLHTQTNPCFENIVVPLSSKHEDGSKRSHSSQPSRARSQSSKISRLPHVPDNSTLSSKAVRSYYAENVPTGSSFERFQRPASVWTFSNQASRMERGHEALNKCRHLKMTSEIIPHRVDRSYYMSGAPKKIHARYDVEDAEFQVMQDLTRSRLRSRTTTPSASCNPTPFSPITSPSKVTKSPYGKEVRKLGHIKAYTFEHSSTQADGESCVMCPEYIVPCLYDVSDKLPESPPPPKYPYSPTPRYGPFAKHGETTSDVDAEEGEVTLGALIDQYLPKSLTKQQAESRDTTASPDLKCVWLRTRRSWSDSDLNILDMAPKVQDVLNLDKKGEYKLKMPAKKFIPSGRKAVTPSPRCCSDFARRKYPKTLPGISTGRNCKKRELHRRKAQPMRRKDKGWLPEVQCYKIRFHQDSRLEKGMVMNTQIETLNRVERVEDDILHDQFPVCRSLQRQRDQHPVRCDCRISLPQTAHMQIAGHKLKLAINRTYA